MTLYLDTSVISALFDKRNPERQEITKEFFATRSTDRMLISELTLMEIENTPDAQLRHEMQEIAARFEAVSVTEEVDRLSSRYIKGGAIAALYSADAYHIAVAVLSNANMVVSWNFRHMVRRKTRDIVNMINTVAGYPHIEIVAPGELL
jgi:predicted nucleic acid-binding protein